MDTMERRLKATVHHVRGLHKGPKAADLRAKAKAGGAAASPG